MLLRTPQIILILEQLTDASVVKKSPTFTET